jgi:pimeloyl-ACP methyl ester carboxylesterase
MTLQRFVLALPVLATLAAGTWSRAPVVAASDDSERILTIDHYVRVASTVPAIAGQPAQLYVRERVSAGQALRARSFADKVVLFVHGAGTPAEVAFDVPHEDYSWMGYLARAGFDVFSMDVTGYGRSTRPPQMSDPCNLAADRQPAFVPSLIAKPCAPSYPGAMTTIASDWDDIGAVVDYIRGLRRVERVSMVAWSLGGPRSGGYAARHAEKVHRLVWLAPAYARGSQAEAPAKLPAPGTVFNTQSRAEFIANWDRQVGCPAQYDPAVAEAVWSSMLSSDAVGATWGPGVRRAPQTTTWGWNSAVVGKMRTPALMVAAVHDAQVNPARVRELHEDYGAKEKVLVDLGCASHNAMWEKTAHTHLFKASLEFLEKGAVNGSTSGVVRLGY